MVNLILPFMEIAIEPFLLSQTSRTFLSNSLFLDVTWKAFWSLNSLSAMAWQQYKQLVLNSTDKLERNFLGGYLSEFEFFALTLAQLS